MFHLLYNIQYNNIQYIIQHSIQSTIEYRIKIYKDSSTISNQIFQSIFNFNSPIFNIKYTSNAYFINLF
jgi:hypothetical protein